jgi:hypothetical protein
MNPVNLDTLRNQYRGTRYAQLAEHHLKRQSLEERILGIQGTLESLPKALHTVGEALIDCWNIRAYDRSFWDTDTATIFDQIIADARQRLIAVGILPNDDTLFTFFHLVTLNFAHTAALQPAMQRFLGIGSGKPPIFSAVSLLYPVGAAIYAATTPMDLPAIIGYGFCNLAYLLLAAGIVAGRFLVLGLKRRSHVFGAALSAFVIGIVLTNLSNF